MYLLNIKVFRRYDRKGRQIAFGSKYEVINKHNLINLYYLQRYLFLLLYNAQFDQIYFERVYPKFNLHLKKLDLYKIKININSYIYNTIDEHVKYLQAIPPASTPRDRTKSPLGVPLSARSPRSKSPLMEKAETATPIQNSQKKLEFTKKEEESLKILEIKYQKQKKLGKQPKQCCIIW